MKLIFHYFFCLVTTSKIVWASNSQTLKRIFWVNAWIFTCPTTYEIAESPHNYNHRSHPLWQCVWWRVKIQIGKMRVQPIFPWTCICNFVRLWKGIQLLIHCGDDWHITCLSTWDYTRTHWLRAHLRLLQYCIIGILFNFAVFVNF